jgi:hypothetical protein
MTTKTNLLATHHETGPGRKNRASRATPLTYMLLLALALGCAIRGAGALSHRPPGKGGATGARAAKASPDQGENSLLVCGILVDDRAPTGADTLVVGGRA